MLKAKAEGVPVTDDGKLHGHGEALDDRHQRRPGAADGDRSRRASCRRWASSSTSARSRRTRCTRGSATSPRSGFDICPNVGWFRDFTDPQSVLEPTFKGAAIKPQGNVNYGMLKDPAIDDGDDQGGD